jgi:lysozyme family protein
MAADNFQKCLAFVLKYEGGRSEDRHDPGGRTMEGITQATYDAWLRKKGIQHKDVFEIPATDRDAIYREEFWAPIHGDQLRHGEDLAVFDFAVNSGPHRALEKWHEVSTAGTATSAVVKGLCDKRLAFLKGLNTWQFFGVGWSKRVAACKTEALKMAAAPTVASGPELASGSVGAILAAIAAVLQYLQTTPQGPIIALGATAFVMFVVSFILRATKAPIGAIPSPAIPAVPSSPMQEMLDLLKQRDKIDARLLEIEPLIKADIAEKERILGQIHPVIIGRPDAAAVSQGAPQQS